MECAACERPARPLDLAKLHGICRRCLREFILEDDGDPGRDPAGFPRREDTAGPRFPELVE